MAGTTPSNEEQLVQGAVDSVMVEGNLSIPEGLAILDPAPARQQL